MFCCLRAFLGIDWSWIHCCPRRHNFGIYGFLVIDRFLTWGLFFREPHCFLVDLFRFPLVIRRAIVRWPFFCCLFDTGKKEVMNKTDNMSIWTIKFISLIHITKLKILLSGVKLLLTLINENSEAQMDGLNTLFISKNTNIVDFNFNHTYIYNHKYNFMLLGHKISSFLNFMTR